MSPLPIDNESVLAWTYCISGIKLISKAFQLHWWTQVIIYPSWRMDEILSKIKSAVKWKCSNNIWKWLQPPSQDPRLQHIREVASVSLAHLIISNVLHFHNLQKMSTPHFMAVLLNQLMQPSIIYFSAATWEWGLKCEFILTLQSRFFFMPV